ncbi:MAG: cation:proton antiporter [Lysobacterales bacterium CG02_land_8_20_14_3_00_62_12]|nr:MAG: cation:proton antiporter [Xanthomonadales bacterium CG02_land_8_20_14_3_00_62_12]
MTAASTWLLLTLAIPLLGALGVLAAHRHANTREAITLVSAAALFTAVVQVLLGFVAGRELTLELWPLFPGLPLLLKVEPLGLLFALLASGLWLVTSVYSIGYLRAKHEEHQTRFYLLFAIALFATVGLAFAGNLLTLFVFYELLTLSTYPLVTHVGNPQAMAGGRRYLGILLLSSIGLFLPAILWTLQVSGTLDFVPGGILSGHLDPQYAALLLALFVLGVGKAAVMPMHRWLPAAMVAPTPVSALLHAVAVVKAGVFTLTKVVIYIFGTGYLATIPAERLLVYLAGFTVIAASLVALRQDNLKRLLAYSTISQLSYIVLATLSLSPMAQIGAALHMLAHGFGKITLFFAAGAIYVAANKTQVSQLDGIGRRMPWTMAAFAIGALTMIGVPPTGGFISKWLIVAGAYSQDDYFVMAVIAASTALNALYFLPILKRAFFNPESIPPSRDHGEAPWPMRLALLITAGASLLLFVFHAPVIELEKSIVLVLP